jgi:hypothetical protein
MGAELLAQSRTLEWNEVFWMCGDVELPPRNGKNATLTVASHQPGAPGTDIFPVLFE